MQCEARDGARQHGTHMRRQIVIPPVEQILQMQPSFGLAFDREASLKEQCVGVFAASRKCDEICESASNRDMRCTHRMAQPARDNLECERERHVVDAQCEALAGEIAESLGDELAAQQLIDCEREQLRLRGRGCQTQQVSKCGMRIEHENVPDGGGTHSCHVRWVCVLIIVNAHTKCGQQR